jgi:hypothetical protein
MHNNPHRNYCMDSSETSTPVQPLWIGLEVLANLFYLASRTETHSAQQRHYLVWAAKVLEDLQHHPKLRD